MKRSPTRRAAFPTLEPSEPPKQLSALETPVAVVDLDRLDAQPRPDGVVLHPARAVAPAARQDAQVAAHRGRSDSARRRGTHVRDAARARGHGRRVARPAARLSARRRDEARAGHVRAASGATHRRPRFDRGARTARRSDEGLAARGGRVRRDRPRHASRRRADAGRRGDDRPPDPAASALELCGHRVLPGARARAREGAGRTPGTAAHGLRDVHRASSIARACTRAW